MRVLRELRAEMGRFLEGQEHGLCVLRGECDYLPFVYRLLQDLETASTDVFLYFPHRFVAAEDYVEIVTSRIEASGREAHGDMTWRLPSLCRDPQRALVERLKETLRCARAMLPRGSDTPRLVVMLCPLEVADEESYRALVHGVAQRGPGAPPWFQRMRIFVHARATTEWRLPPFVRTLRVELSAEVLTASAALDAEDPSLSSEQRAQALLQAAMLDVGNRHFGPARRKLEQLYAAAQALKSPVLAAQALSGLGDIERIISEPDAAIGWYERALAPASEAGAAIVLLTITTHLAELYFGAGRVADAEIFYDGAQQLAAVIPEPETQVTSLRGRGLAQQQRGAAATEWVASFVAAAEVARDNERAALLADLRVRLEASRSHPLPAELRRSIDELLGGGA